MQSRVQAFALLSEYTKSESLIKHSLAVECAMGWYATYFKQDAAEIEKWKITGLLHDFDYEKYPEPTSPDGHPFKGNQILSELGFPEDVRRAIMGHALYTNTPRDTLMAKALFAVDELTGLITASVYVRPDKSILTLEVSSVNRKLKDKAFARGCSRDDMRLGAQELEIELLIHIGNVLTAMKETGSELGLA